MISVVEHIANDLLISKQNFFKLFKNFKLFDKYY